MEIARVASCGPASLSGATAAVMYDIARYCKIFILIYADIC